MNRNYRRLLLALSVLILFRIEIFSQVSRNIDSPRTPARKESLAKAIDQLLAATPLLPGGGKVGIRKRATFDEPPPSDDAPIQELIRYWTSVTNEYHSLHFQPPRLVPSDIVRRRFLAALEDRPQLSASRSFNDLLPASPETFDLIHNFMTNEPRDCRGDNYDSWRDGARYWLKQRSRYYVHELIGALRAGEERAMELSEYLKTLARVDREAAAPFLEKYKDSNDPYMKWAALCSLYRNAAISNNSEQMDIYRPRMREFVADIKVESTLRHITADVLLHSDWEGQEEWMASLISNPDLTRSLLSSAEQAAATFPLNRQNYNKGNDSFVLRLMREYPDKLIPAAIKQIGRNDAVVIRLLHGFIGTRSSPSTRAGTYIELAFRALLPYLDDPNVFSADYRDFFISRQVGIFMPELIPDLIKILDKFRDPLDRQFAAQSLIKYRDPQAVPALRRALMSPEKPTKIDPHGLLREVVKALLSSGGLSTEEIISALESCGSGGVASSTSALPNSRIIGEILFTDCREEIQTDERLVNALFTRIKTLMPSHPEMSQFLLENVRASSLPIAQVNLFERIADGSANSKDLEIALETRDRLMKTSGENLLAQSLNQAGFRAGIFAVLTSNRERVIQILSGTDAEAQRAALACARYLREKLPIGHIAELLKTRDQQLVSTAESYLRIEDSAAAHKLIRALHPNERLILGRSFLVASDSLDALMKQVRKWEEQLQQEVERSDGPNEIYALFNRSAPWGYVIRVHGGKAAEFELTLDKQGTRFRSLGDNEYQELRSFTTRPDVEDMGPEGWETETSDGYLFLRLTREGGLRIFLEGFHRTPKNPTLHRQLAGLLYSFICSGSYQAR